MPIDANEVRRIAELARLELDDREVASLGRQLRQIVDHVARLDRLDCSGVPPTACAVEEPVPLRTDEVRPSLGQRGALHGAPDAAEGHFRVPRVLDE